MTTAIDLSRVAAPTAIDALSYKELLSAFKVRFQAFWEEARLADTSLPAYDESMLETSPPIIVGQAWSYLRLLDRQRVNDALKALLAPLSTGSNLDNLVAGRNIERIVESGVSESDASLLLRFLDSFDAPAAGSTGRYLFDARSAWPQLNDGSGMLDVRVNGYAVHGRRGDVDVVIAGPGGATPTNEQILTVRAAVTHIDRAPDGVDITVLAAERVEYAANLVIEVPAIGPAPEVVRAEALARVNAAAASRLLIGGEIPDGYLAGAAYGPNIIKVRDLTQVAIEPDPYKIPVMTGVTMVTEVRS